MALLPQLGLAPPKSMPLVKAVGAKTAGKAPKGVVDMDGDVQTARVVKLSIGAIRWPGHAGQLLAFTDADGKLVTGGKRPGWRHMATGNLFSGRIVHALSDLGQLEERWRANAAEARKAAVAGQALLKRVQDASDTFLKEKAGNGPLREAMKAYFDKLSALTGMKEHIVQATEGLIRAIGELGATVKEEEIQKVEEEIRKVEGDIAAVKAEAQAVKDVVAKVLEVGEGIRDFATAPDPTKAIALLSQGVNAVAGAIIDSRFAAELGRLEAQLQSSQENLEKARHAKMFYLVTARQADVRKAISVCREADDAFANAVEKMTIARADAQDRTQDQKETQVFGEAIRSRSEQRTRIETLKVQCETYLKVIAPLAENIPKARDQFAYVSDWIADVGADDPRLAPGTAWASNSEQVGRGNAIELGNWIERTSSVTADCRKTLQSMDEKGAAALTAPFDTAEQIVRDLLSQSRPASTAPARGRG